MAEQVIKNKLVLKDLGNPKDVHKSDKDSILLGTIVGIATGIFEKPDAKDPTKVFKGLKGTFEGVPAAKDKDRTVSGVLYLPDGFFNMLAANFEGDNPVRALEFAAEVLVKKASNPAGYEFGFNPKVKPGEGDPLAALKERAKIPALADGTAKGK